MLSNIITAHEATSRARVRAYVIAPTTAARRQGSAMGMTKVPTFAGVNDATGAAWSPPV